MRYVYRHHMSTLPHISTARLSQSVVRVFEERILGGEWPPGERLPAEPELCRQLGVSRSVVRDAVRTLAARGMLEVRHGIGTTVAQPTDAAYADAILILLLRGEATVGEALQARKALEVAAAGIAAVGRTDADLEVLEDCYAGLEKATAALDVDAALAIDLRFHTAIIEATHIPVLITLLRPMAQIIQRTSRPPAVDPRFLDLGKHRAVVDAIRSGDAESARSAMERHFRFMDDERYASMHSMKLRDAPRADSVGDGARGAA